MIRQENTDISGLKLFVLGKGDGGDILIDTIAWKDNK